MFLDSERFGRETFDARVGLCMDIAVALMALHESGRCLAGQMLV